MQFSLGSSTGGCPTYHWTLRACPSPPTVLPCPMLNQPPPDPPHTHSDPPRDHMPLTVSTCSLLPPYLGRTASQIPGAGLLSRQARATAPGLQAGTFLLLPGPGQTRALSQGSIDYSATCSSTPAVPSEVSLKKNRTSACLSACPRDSRSHRRCHSQNPSHCMAGRHQWQSSRL